MRNSLMDNLQHSLENIYEETDKVQNEFLIYLISINKENKNFNYNCLISKSFSLDENDINEIFKTRFKSNLGIVISDLMETKGICNNTLAGCVGVSLKTIERFKGSDEMSFQLDNILKTTICTECTYEEGKKLIASAGYNAGEGTLSKISFILYFLKKGIYDPFIIDEILYSKIQKTLFSSK